MPASERIDTFQQIVDTLGAGSLSEAVPDIVRKLKNMVADGVRDCKAGSLTWGARRDAERLVNMLEQAGIGAEIRDNRKFTVELWLHLDGELGHVDEGFDADAGLAEKFTRIADYMRSKYWDNYWTRSRVLDPMEQCMQELVDTGHATMEISDPSLAGGRRRYELGEREAAFAEIHKALDDLLNRFSKCGVRAIKISQNKYHLRLE